MSVPSIEQIAATLASAGFGGVTLSALERAGIFNALLSSRGNRTHAAHQLGVSVRTIQRKLKASDDASFPDQSPDDVEGATLR
ncbi:helix-turn-helix domain-containing protein [Lacipirellula sp.]|uniref:helix-turn-helix domain-containing protein n=1 Tax=Lacipirellula sp. TaxID=2691419 RepID=UPI003D13C2D4